VLAIAGFAAFLAAAGGRSTIEVYYDILGAIHLIGKAGESATLSNIGHRARVPNNRLKDRMRELLALGFVDSERSVTKRGYNYCIDYRKEVEPFLLRYRLDRKSEHEIAVGLVR
jgi:hypothetical protein